MCKSNYGDNFTETDKLFHDPKSRKSIEDNQSPYLDETPEETEENDKEYQNLLEKRKKSNEN